MSREKPGEIAEQRDRAILVGVQRRNVPIWEVNDHLDELEQLLDTAGGVTVGRFIQDRHHPDARLFLGSGKVQELHGMLEALEAKIAIFDDDLTPGQMRNLEKELQCRVMDRAGLILDIFATRARTREARIQVQLAQSLYLLPRLTGRWRHFSRQVSGPIARGPGETQLELDKQAIKKHVSRLKRELKRIEKARETRRHRRQGMYKAAIIGYTNAGKSTLINALTHSNIFVEDRLFATLDPTVRSYRLPDGSRILLIDTVGFIRKLPLGLMTSFKSTLEESRRADLFIHVVDISHPHWEGQLLKTDELLKELKLGSIPQILVFNKVDAIEDPLLIEGLQRQFPGALFISALREIRLHDLPLKIAEYTQQRFIRKSESFRPDEVVRLKDLEERVQVVGRSFVDGLIVVEYIIPDHSPRKTIELSDDELSDEELSDEEMSDEEMSDGEYEEGEEEIDEESE